MPYSDEAVEGLVKITAERLGISIGEARTRIYNALTRCNVSVLSPSHGLVTTEQVSIERERLAEIICQNNLREGICDEE